MFGQRQVVRVIGRRQTEGVGEDKRLVVQPHGVAEFDAKSEEVVEMLGRCV
jgi:hypothetical protein